MLIAVMAAFSSAICFAEETLKMQDENDEINYSLGYQIGGDLKRQKVEIRSELIVQGIKDAMTGTEPLLSPKEMRGILVDLKRRVQKADHEKLVKERTANLAAGEAFLSENAKKEGIRVLPSGLQYRVIREGSGAMPRTTDTVTVNYRGSLIDGAEFDSSYKRNKPASFRVDRVIRGWTEALLNDEGRRRVGTLYSRRNILRRARGRKGNPPQQRPGFPGGTDLRRVEQKKIDL